LCLLFLRSAPWCQGYPFCLLFLRSAPWCRP
jgi:hypothetical protein